MSARFAETCRGNAIAMEGVELEIERLSLRDGRSQKDLLLKCEKDIYIGVFFDGTNNNNNKYSDTHGLSQSNVARLYEVYPGTPAKQEEPVFKPKIMADGKPENRPAKPDVEFKSDSV